MKVIRQMAIRNFRIVLLKRDKRKSIQFRIHKEHHFHYWLRHKTILPKQCHNLYGSFNWATSLMALIASALVYPLAGNPRMAAELYKLYLVISLGPNVFFIFMKAE